MIVMAIWSSDRFRLVMHLMSQLFFVYGWRIVINGL